MTAAEVRSQQSTALHNKLRSIFQDAERLAHDAVQAEDNAQALAEHWKGIADRQRGDLESANTLARGYSRALEEQREEVKRVRGNLTHALAELAAIREVLGATEDVDLVERARSLVDEVKRLIMQDILKRERAERAEAECDRLKTGIALAYAYKAAVDAQSGVADAQAALFAVLEEVENVAT